MAMRRYSGRLATHGPIRYTVARKASTSARSGAAAKTAPKGRQVSSSSTVRRSKSSVDGRSNNRPE